MVDARVGDPRLVTIENQTCFEAYVREGLPDGGIAVWTGGFLGEVERELIAHLVGAGVERILHWGDLDPDGLAILEHVARSVGVPVEPLRMEPRLLDRLPGRPLTDRDVRLLEARIAAGGPYAELAAAMQRTGVKVEQEAWYLEREG
jgi:hypothetical protein